MLSKGHCAPGLYAVLAERGFFPKEDLETLRHIGSHLQGHPNMNDTPGVDMSTGSPACDMDEGVAAGETYIMGRVAVLSPMRRRGLASRIVEASEAAARDAGAKLIKLHAQEYVLPLYAKAGYTQIAPVDYEDEGQPHAWMAKRMGDR